jgi:hypothetical protein
MGEGWAMGIESGSAIEQDDELAHLVNPALSDG